MTTVQPVTSLVVDDNPDHRKIFRSRLESGGYSVVEVSSGREALAAIEKTRFALMTLDLSKPDMDGFDVSRAVRSKHPELKVIVASGFLHGKMLEPAKSHLPNRMLLKDRLTQGTPKARLSDRTTECSTQPSTSAVIFEPGDLPASFCEVGSWGPPMTR
jgi:CheY-like chemotaxis protein